jgi:hypothetical protein
MMTKAILKTFDGMQQRIRFSEFEASTKAEFDAYWLSLALLHGLGFCTFQIGTLVGFDQNLTKHQKYM